MTLRTSNLPKADTRASHIEIVITDILEAAQEEFAVNGFAGARMQVIADRAGYPKANVHYHFKNKTSLYLAVLDRIVTRWDDYLNDISVDDDPAVVLDTFIREKVQFSFDEPSASRLFANEIIHGAPHLRKHISSQIRPYVIDRVAVIQSWIDAGKMMSVDPMRLIFLIWSTTQHYADFQSQILIVTKQKKYTQEYRQETADFLSKLILSGCGLTLPSKNNQLT
jgi:TetR/AcrR family transcriptional regulator